MCEEDYRHRSRPPSDFGLRLAHLPFDPPGPADIAAFRQVVHDHYRQHGRDLPWRRTRDPYAILVSEVMLQQTQVARVIPKYGAFLAAFPTVSALADAGAARVLALWQGLGYNRRALALHRAAQIVVAHHQGTIPASTTSLRSLPGVGPYTASAVCVFAYDRPLPLIETNIRAAFIHFFFQGCLSVADADIIPLVELTLDHKDPRTWYYGLMDYGARLKRVYENPGRKSRHHTAQPPFAGSHRQLRGAVLRALLVAAPAALAVDDPKLRAAAPDTDPAAMAAVLEELAEEGFLLREGRSYQVA
jgi:A/G-specific adenine glycosylase